MDALITLPTKSVEFWFTLVLFSLHQMTPLHLAAESNRIKMVECLLDQGVDINIQDDNQVNLHNNAVDYIIVIAR